METRTLGRELRVSAVGMGAMGLSFGLGPAADKQDAIKAIPGTRQLHRLEENLGAAEIDLTPQDLRAIDTATSDIAIHGARGTGREHYA